MLRRLFLGLLVTLLVPVTVPAQTGQGGGLRGYVKDPQGGVLSGVVVTASSPELIRPTTGTTDAEGYFRLNNLPPGTYAVTAELQGFSAFRREGIVVRAGSTFQVDIELTLGSLQETVTVTDKTPMLDVKTAGNVLNIDGEFQKQLPVHARRNWTDFLEITPGVHSRPFDDGSGRMVYFGHATEHFAHVVQLEGMQAGNYNDFQLTFVQMGSDMIQDTQVKTGGADASTPMGTGLAINVVTKSGGNTMRGTAGLEFQPLRWNGKNEGAQTAFVLDSAIQSYSTCPEYTCESVISSPVQTDLSQFDGSIGGPIARDRMWFFGSLRVSRVETGIGRVDKQVSDITSYFPGTELFPNKIKGYQPYVKVTNRISNRHELQTIFQRDRTNGQNNWEYLYEPIDAYSNGGNLYSVKGTSAWSNTLATSFSVDSWRVVRRGWRGNVDPADGVRVRPDAAQSAGHITGDAVAAARHLGRLAVLQCRARRCSTGCPLGLGLFSRCTVRGDGGRHVSSGHAPQDFWRATLIDLAAHDLREARTLAWMSEDRDYDI
jgi:hypothetical protein